MGFNNSDQRPDVTAEPSPDSRPRGGVIPRRVRVWADAACDALADVGGLFDLLSGTMRAAIEKIDRSVPPESAAPVTATVDLGLALRVAELERAVEALAPVPVVERRVAHGPCAVCGGAVVLVLEGAPQSPAGWITGLCAGCRTLHSARPDSEVLP